MNKHFFEKLKLVELLRHSVRPVAKIGRLEISSVKKFLGNSANLLQISKYFT